MKSKLAMLIVLLALFLAACGTQNISNVPTLSPENTSPPVDEGTAGVPQTGMGTADVPANLDEVVSMLRAAGATVNLADPVESDVLSIPGQIVHINNEEVEFYTNEAAEAAAAEAPLVADLATPDGEPQFYRLGNMLVRYVGSGPELRDLLEHVLGAQAAKQ